MYGDDQCGWPQVSENQFTDDSGDSELSATQLAVKLSGRVTSVYFSSPHNLIGLSVASHWVGVTQFCGLLLNNLQYFNRVSVTNSSVTHYWTTSSILTESVSQTVLWPTTAQPPVSPRQHETHSWQWRAQALYVSATDLSLLKSNVRSLIGQFRLPSQSVYIGPWADV